MFSNKAIAKKLITQAALNLGFSHIGFAKAEFMDKEAQRLEQWLQRGMHGEMAYMERNFDKRTDPRLLVEGAKTVVSLVFNYFPSKNYFENADFKIARYAFGEDYHHVLKDKLKSLLKFINESITETNGRCFVDSAPVLERDWALRSGNGWVGKNSLMIHPRKGSYFFLAELIIDLEVEYDQPFSKNFCGSCTRCIDACPTGAIAKDGYVVDSNKCISYLTIEYKGEIPSEYKDKFSKWIFGCDICQEVCPWNRFSTSHTEETFNANEKLQNMERSTQWLELTEEVFQQLFRRSAVKRTKYDGLKRNIFFLLK